MADYSASTEGLADLLERRAIENGDSVYLEDARSDSIVSYGELAGAAARWRVILEYESIPLGGSVIVDVADPLAFAVVHLSVIAAGRRSVPTNPDLATADLQRIIGLLDGAVIVVSDRSDRHIPGARVVAPDAPSIGEPSPIDPNASGAALLFTSGSTGEPKGVELGEGQLLFVARAIAKHNQLTESDRGYNPLPLFHVNAEVVGLLATLVAGGTLVLDRRFHRTGFWELLEHRRISWLNAVPAMLAVLARGGALTIPPSVRFVRSASAPLPDAVRSALGSVPVVVSWGMTEGASQITATPLGAEHRAGSVGLPVGSEVQVRAESGDVLGIDDVGALWVRGEGIVRGYHRGRAAERFDADGWLSSGDLGRIDADGWVYLVGRSDDVINRGGEKVYPAEVEEVLLGDARVREAVVVGRSDPILHQVAVAYVIPVEPQPRGRDVLITELLERCERELPRFKRPVEISVVDDVPRAPTGKVQRNRVRALAENE